MKLLIDEHPLLVLPSLAKAIGLSEALLLQQLHYWIETKGHERDGRRWVFNSYEAWTKQFPWWHAGSIRRIVTRLRQLNLITTTSKYNRNRIDNTLWYSINYDQIDRLSSPPADHEPEPEPPVDPPPSDENGAPSVENDRPPVQNAQTTRAKRTDHAREMHRPIPETTTETSPETNPGDNNNNTPAAQVADAVASALSQAGVLADQHQRIAAGWQRNQGRTLTAEDVEAWTAYVDETNRTRDARQHLRPGFIVDKLRRGQSAPAPTQEAEFEFTFVLE